MGVRIIVLYDDALRAAQRNNYMSALQIFQSFFAGVAVPADVQDLFNMINDQQEFTQSRPMLHLHGAVLQVSEYSALYKDMHEHIQLVIDKPQLRNLLANLPYVDDWDQRIKTNSLLIIPYHYNPKSYTVPAGTKNQTCLSKDQQSILAKLGLARAPGQSQFTAEQLQLVKALQFTDYPRNRSAHRMEPYKIVQFNPQGLSYNSEGSEMSSYVRLPLLIPSMQRQLVNIGRLLEVQDVRAEAEAEAMEAAAAGAMAAAGAGDGAGAGAGDEAMAAAGAGDGAGAGAGDEAENMVIG